MRVSDSNQRTTHSSQPYHHASPLAAPPLRRPLPVVVSLCVSHSVVSRWYAVLTESTICWSKADVCGWLNEPPLPALARAEDECAAWYGVLGSSTFMRGTFSLSLTARLFSSHRRLLLRPVARFSMERGGRRDDEDKDCDDEGLWTEEEDEEDEREKDGADESSPSATPSYRDWVWEWEWEWE